MGRRVGTEPCGTGVVPAPPSRENGGHGARRGRTRGGGRPGHARRARRIERLPRQKSKARPAEEEAKRDAQEARRGGKPSARSSQADETADGEGVGSGSNRLPTSPVANDLARQNQIAILMRSIWNLVTPSESPEEWRDEQGCWHERNRLRVKS